MYEWIITVDLPHHDHELFAQGITDIYDNTLISLIITTMYIRYLRPMGFNLLNGHAVPSIRVSHETESAITKFLLMYTPAANCNISVEKIDA